MILIKLPYWLGIIVDALWAVALFSPSVFGLLIGNPDFDPDVQIRLVMGIGGTLMTGWTILLLWAVQDPIDRKMVALITAFPVILGMFIIALIGLINGSVSNIWILTKTLLLIILFTKSYIRAGKIEQTNFIK
jgi:hypothetical protein